MSDDYAQLSDDRDYEIVEGVHSLKTWPPYFKAIALGEKTFEIRVNDRDFHERDFLVLQEYIPDTKQFTGKYIVKRIGFMLQGQWGVPADICVMSLLSVVDWQAKIVSESIGILAEAHHE